MYEELIAQMRYCAEDHSILECAKKCPYWNAERQHGYCFLELMAKAAEAMERQQTFLRAQNAALEAEVDDGRT